MRCILPQMRPPTSSPAILEGMGVRVYFDRLYGPDLVKAHKTSPPYYQRTFKECALHSNQALIIDDSPQAIAHTRRAGAQALLVDRSAQAPVSSYAAHQMCVPPD